MADPPAPGTGPDGADDQPGWAAPGGVPREPAAGDATPPAPPTPPAPGTPPPTPATPGAAPPSAAWQAPVAPVPPVPPGTPGAPGAVPGRRSRAWIWILAIVLGVTLVAAVIGTVLFVERSVPPFDAASDWVQDMEHGRFNEAYDQLCAPDRQLDNAEGFRSAFGGLFRNSRSATTNALSVDRDGDRATVEFTVFHNGSQDDHSYELPLRLEGDDWHACPGDSLRS